MSKTKPKHITEIHTITITVNGFHGGWDVVLHGDDSWGGPAEETIVATDLTEARTIIRIVSEQGRTCQR